MEESNHGPLKAFFLGGGGGGVLRGRDTADLAFSSRLLCPREGWEALFTAVAE